MEIKFDETGQIISIKEPPFILTPTGTRKAHVESEKELIIKSKAYGKAVAQNMINQWSKPKNSANLTLAHKLGFYFGSFKWKLNLKLEKKMEFNDIKKLDEVENNLKKLRNKNE